MISVGIDATKVAENPCPFLIKSNSSMYFPDILVTKSCHLISVFFTSTEVLTVHWIHRKQARVEEALLFMFAWVLQKN